LDDLPRSDAQQHQHVVTKEGHLEWANCLLQITWPEMNQLVGHIVSEKIVPMLRAKLPATVGKDLAFSEFTLGKSPPRFESVDVYELPHSTACMHARFAYMSDMSVQMSIGAASFGIKDLTVRGQLVLIIHPFMEDRPGVGGVTAYFINPPKVNLTFTGLAKAADISGIKGIVRQSIDDAIAEKFVLPNSLTKLMRFSDFTMFPTVMGNPKPIGMMRITLLGAKDMPKGDWLSFSGTEDNYMRLSIGNEVWHAKVVDLNQAHDFTIFDPQQIVSIDLWDEDYLTDDDHLATAGQLSLVQATDMSTKELQMHDPSDKHQKAGTVELKFEYFTTSKGLCGVGGSIVMFVLQEVTMPAEAVKKSFFLHTKLLDQEYSSQPGVVIKATAEQTAISVLNDMRERLRKEGLKENAIERLTQLQGLTDFDSTTVRLAFNVSIPFNVRSVEDFDSGVIECNLIDFTARAESKKKHGKDLDHGASKDIVLGHLRVPLSGLKDSHRLGGHFHFTGQEKGTSYEAKLVVSVHALKPGDRIEDGGSVDAAVVHQKSRPTVHIPL